MWQLAGLRLLAADFAPSTAVVALLLLAAWLTPLLGGPSIDFPSARSLIVDGLWEGVAAGSLTLILALLLTRILAIVRGLRGLAVPSRPFPAAGRSLLRLAPRAVMVLAGMLLLRVLMPTFVGFKRAIPDFQPFGPRDVLLGRLDHALHLGVDPWRLLHPLVGRPQVTAVIDLLYVRWYFVSVLAFVCLIFWLRGPRRAQFLLAFAATWVFLGVLIATGMSSVGPCYVDRVLGGESAYAPLMGYLSSVDQVYPLQALTLQEELWQAYVTGDNGLVSGISAMPSLHVAIPALFAVATWRRSHVLSGVFWLYTLVIVVGSVHLGWHYAVDGYVSIALVFPLWWVSGLVVRGWYARTRAWRWGWGRASAGAAG